jgi:hypothetical protein
LYSFVFRCRKKVELRGRFIGLALSGSPFETNAMTYYTAWSYTYILNINVTGKLRDMDTKTNLKAANFLMHDQDKKGCFSRVPVTLWSTDVFFQLLLCSPLDQNSERGWTPFYPSMYFFSLAYGVPYGVKFTDY